MKVDFSSFENVKSQVVWNPIVEWIRGHGAFRHFAWKGFRPTNGQKIGIPLFFLYINVNEESDMVSTSLYANIYRDPSGKGQKIIDSQTIGNKKEAKNILPAMLLDRYGIDVGGVSKFEIYFGKQDISSTGEQKIEQKEKQKVREIRLINRKNLLLAVLYLNKVNFHSSLSKRNIIGFQTQELIFDFKTGNVIPKRNVGGSIYPTFERAEYNFNLRLEKFKTQGYVDPKDEGRQEIPYWATTETWDVELSIPKKLKDDFIEHIETIERKVEEIGSTELAKLLEQEAGHMRKNIRYSQAGWYAGEIPDPKKIEQYVGTPNVDAGQIKTVFAGADDAINLVNRFDSSLLLNIGFMFNFSNQGAYGVYLPLLDDKIKREKIKDVLRKENLTIEEKPDGSFYAYSEIKSPEEIQKEINNTYNKLKQEGGHVFGINMNKVLMASKADADAMELTNQEDINDIVTLHLGATITHEAIHAKGSTSESPSEQTESSFLNWALPIVNEKRLQKFRSMNKEQEFSPLIITPYRRALGNWYNIIKLSQNYLPTGAQFSAQLPNTFKDFSEFSYGLMFGNFGKGPVESLLESKRPLADQTREFLIDKKLSLKNIIEPLMKIDKDDFITENLLEKDRKEFDAYKPIEKALEDKRPKPIILPESKSSNKFQKFATLFGWMNNLDLPMRERMIPNADSDEFLFFDWNEIRKLPRYNYDGSTYYYAEPRFQAELFDQMISNRPTSFINPARRFAQKSKEYDHNVILRILGVAREKITLSKMMGTRLLCSEDLLPFVLKFYKDDEKIEVKICDRTKINEYNDVFPIWIYRYSIPSKKIEMAEDYFNKKDKSKEAKEIFDFLTGDISLKKQTINTILKVARNISNQYKIEDVFVVGGFPRNIVMKESWDDIHDLDFASAWPEQCIKLGGMLAEVLGVENTELYHRTMTLSWEWMGVKCDFKGSYKPIDIRKLLRKYNIKTTSLNLDIYARDFTMNMLIYDINKQKIYDVCKQSVDDIKNKLIRTYFPEVEESIRQNPILILRALKYMIRYDFIPELELDRAMRQNINLLFGKQYTEERIGMGFLELISENSKKAKILLKEYNLYEKCKEYLNYANVN